MVGGEGLDQPSTEGDHGVIQADAAGESYRAVPEQKTGSFIIRAWNNAGVIYIGFNEDVDTNDGFPMEDGDIISIDLDSQAEDVFFYAQNAGDQIRYITVN